MIRYALTRLTLLVVGLFVASALIFFTLRVLPGDVAQLIGGTQASPAQVEAIRLKLGLNEPLLAQYASWMGGVLRGAWKEAGRSHQRGHRAAVGEGRKGTRGEDLPADRGSTRW